MAHNITDLEINEWKVHLRQSANAFRPLGNNQDGARRKEDRYGLGIGHRKIFNTSHHLNASAHSDTFSAPV